MNHQVLLRDYRRVMGGTVRKLPDGRRLVTRLNQPPTIVDESRGVLLQHLDDRLFSESALTHVRLPIGTDSTQKRGHLRGAGQGL